MHGGNDTKNRSVGDKSDNRPISIGSHMRRVGSSRLLAKAMVRVYGRCERVCAVPNHLLGAAEHRAGRRLHTVRPENHAVQSSGRCKSEKRFSFKFTSRIDFPA